MTGWASARQAPLNRQLIYQEAMVRSIQPIVSLQSLDKGPSDLVTSAAQL